MLLQLFSLYSLLFVFVGAGGPADKAGLKKQEVVIAVNGKDTTELSHHEVVSIISNTKSLGVWLTVCDGPQSSSSSRTAHTPPNLISNERLSFGRVQSLGASTPVIPKNMTDGTRYSTADDSPPKYQDLARYNNNRHGGSGSGSNNATRHRDMTNSMVPISTSNKMSPLAKTHVTPSLQQNGFSSSSSALHHKPALLHLATFGSSDQSLFANSKSPTPAATAFTSASVLVLYIGPVEIPESWSSRELSSKCLQECTRRLLSQRQEFVEAFLEITLSSMKILAVSQTVIFKHKREELYYAGVCSNDEQTFGIVTRKLDQKSGKKSLSGSNIGKSSNRAHMCHVFKVIQHKSVLILHSGADSKDSKAGKTKQLTAQHKQKTIPIKSCVTIVNAIQGIFTGTAVPGSKIFDESPSKSQVHVSPNSSNETMYPNGTQEKLKKKKLDVVDLRPSAYLPPSSVSSILSSSPSTNQNMYVSLQHKTTPITASTSASNHHSRSLSNPAMEYSPSGGTPSYQQQQRLGPGGSGGGGGGTSWYANDSPKEEYLPRTRSWDNKSPSGRPSRDRSGHHSGGSSGNRRPLGGKISSSLQYDQMKRFSDGDSSISSLSDSRPSSPTKTSHRSSYGSHSRSPSPNRSSYSSRSRSPSPAHQAIRWTTPNSASYRLPRRTGASAARKLKSGIAFEVGSSRSGAISPNSMARSFRGPRAQLKRQVRNFSDIR